MESSGGGGGGGLLFRAWLSTRESKTYLMSNLMSLYVCELEFGRDLRSKREDIATAAAAADNLLFILLSC